jgi:diguanylate cyclase (GGDEF)-like protein
MNLTEFLGRQSKAILFAIGSVLLAAVVLADFASGPRFEASLFYLIPVSFFAWFCGRQSGFIVAVMCGAIAFAIHRGHFPSDSSIVYWNVLTWLAVYVFFLVIISELRSLYLRERTWSRTDPLTSVANRRAFFEQLENEAHRARRYRHPLTIAYVDLDRFKEVNDTLGHSTGDKLLGIVASAMKRELRRADVVARLGGDEFALLLPETDGRCATAALRKLRSRLNRSMNDQNWPVTFSIGVVTFHTPPGTIQEMLNAADEAMYTAKKRGTGNIVIERAE